MAVWADLNQEQKNQVLTYDRFVRANVGNLSQVLANFQVMSDYWESTVGAIIPNLTGDIPSDSGLAGIELKSGAFYNAVNTSLDALLASHYGAANRQVYIEMAGPLNVIGRLNQIDI